MTLVSIVRAVNGYQEVYPALQRAVDLAGGIGLESGDSVAIKINLCAARPPETGAITHPVFLDALLQYLRETHGDLQIHVVESDATVVLADEFIRWFGFLPILEKWDAKWWNLSEDEIVEKEINGLYLKQVPVPALLTRSRLISLSKLKTNSLSRITTSLKNQFGCLPMVEKSVFHDHLAEVITDVNLAMPPHFCIVDGIIGMGGPKGPSYGVLIRAKVILAGHDPVAVAAASAEFMGIRPSSVKHIRMAEAAGVGSTKYTTRADDGIDRVDFERDWLCDLQLRLARSIKRAQRMLLRKGWTKA